MESFMRILPDLRGLNNIILCYDEEKLQDKFELCRSSLEHSGDYELEADTVLLDSFHSATIEGARTTIENVKKSLTAPGSKSDRMVVNNLHLGGYYRSLEKAEKPIILEGQIALDLTVFAEYMLDRITEACRMAEMKQYHLTESEKKLLTRMSKRGIGAEITVAAAAGILGVGEQRARGFRPILTALYRMRTRWMVRRRLCSHLTAALTMA